MGRKPRVDRTPEEKWQIVQEGLRSGNVSETCRRHGMAPRCSIGGGMKRNREPRPRLGEKRGGSGNGEGPPHPATGADAGTEVAGDRDTKKRRGGVSCGEAHSHARELVAHGQTATLVATTLAISRSSLYYRKKPRASRADRQYDEQIVVACGEKPAYGYRRVAWWLWRKEGLAKPDVREDRACACIGPRRAGDTCVWSEPGENVGGSMISERCSNGLTGIDG